MIKIVPARPITNAPHQLVSRESVPASCDVSDMRGTPLPRMRTPNRFDYLTSRSALQPEGMLAGANPHNGRQAMTHDEVRKRAKDDGIQFFLAQFVEMHGKPNAK